MSHLRRLETKLAAWRSFRGIARSTRTLAAAQALQWSEHVQRTEAYLRACDELAAAYPCPDRHPFAGPVLVVVGTDLGLCGALNGQLASRAREVAADRGFEVRVIVGTRVAELLAWDDAVVHPTPTSFGAVELLAATIGTWLEERPSWPPRALEMVSAVEVEPDGRPVIARLCHDPGASTRRSPAGVAELTDLGTMWRQTIELRQHAFVVDTLTRAARSEAQARWKTMHRAHDAADAYIERQEKRLRSLRQEVITQEMLEARGGHRGS